MRRVVFIVRRARRVRRGGIGFAGNGCGRGGAL